MILTARGDETDRVAGLELGADDYVVKPFSPRSSSRACGPSCGESRPPPRRRAHHPRATSCSTSCVVEVTAGGRVVTLRRPSSSSSPPCPEPGRVWTRSQLLDAVHGFSLETYERAIDGHVRNLRRKLEPDPGRHATCGPCTASGYALVEEDA